MLARPTRLLALLCLLLALHLATAQSFQVIRRDNGPPPGSVDGQPPPPPPPSDSAKPDDKPNPDNSAKAGDDAKPPQTTGGDGKPAPSNTHATITSSPTEKPKPTHTAKGGAVTSALDNPNFVNCTKCILQTPNMQANSS